MNLSIPEAIVTIREALRDKPAVASLFDLFAAEYGEADAHRNAHEAKFMLLESAGIDVVRVLARIESGTATDEMVARINRLPSPTFTDGVDVFFGDRCMSITVGICEDSGDLREHAQLLARSISALTRCVRVVAEGTDGTREGAPDSVGGGLVGIEFLSSISDGLFEAASARARSDSDDAK